MFKVLTGTVNEGSNIFEITDNEISDGSIIEVYPGDESIIPVEVSVTGHVLLVTFDVKASDNIPIKIFINNLEGEFEPSGGGSAYDILWRTIPGIGDESVGEGLDAIQERAVNTEEALYNKVPEQTVPGGVLYHATSGNTWKKLDASNLDYDEQSTIYSAIGNIDDLETTATNLVDAINEVKESGGGGGISYSTTESVIGSYLGKPLYSRVFNNLGAISLSASAWTNTQIPRGEMYRIIRISITTLGTSGGNATVDGAFISDTLNVRSFRTIEYDALQYNINIEYVKNE